MTISTPYVPQFSSGNGVTTSFPVGWPFAAGADLDVQLIVVATGLPLAPAPILNGPGANDYTVSGTPDPDTGIYPSGSVVFNAAPSASYEIFRGRATSDVQDKLLPNNGPFPAKAVEGALDRRAMRSQEEGEELGRALVAPATDAPLDLTIPADSIRGGFYLVFDQATKQPRNSVLSEAELAAILALVTLPAAAAAALNQVSLAQSVAQGLTLAQADAVAAAAGYDLVIDRNYTLPANTTINSKLIRFMGGAVTFGAFNLIGTGKALLAGAAQIFNQNSTGRLTGTFLSDAINALWWWNGANDTAALQASLTYVNQSANRNAKLDWTGRASWSVTAQLVSDCGDQPQIIGSNGGIASSLSPDSTNIVASGLSAGTAILKVIGRAAPCGGSIQGFYFDSAPGAGLTAVEVDDAVGMLLRNAPSPNIARMNFLHNTSSEFTENTVICDVVAGLGPTAVYLELAVTGGTNSFSGLDIDVDISLNAGDRSGVPVIKADTGSFPYNGRCSVFIHNNGASNVVIFSKPDTTPPWWFAGGAIRLEGADAHPIIVNDLAGAPFYYGGTGPFCQGLTFAKAVVDISNIVYCDAFSYQPSGSVATKGARIYQQTIIFNGSLGVELASPLNPNFAKVTGIVTASGYEAVFSTEFVVDQSGGVNGTKGNDLISLNTDTHSYGNPTIAMDSSKRIKLTNGSWPNVAANFSVVFQIRQLGD